MGRVWVVGNISLDVVLGGIEDFPGWGVEVLIPGYVMRPGGAATNAALALTGLGVSNFLVGVVGDDFAGKEVIGKLEKQGVNLSFLDVARNVATGLSVAVTHSVTLERTFLTDLGAQAVLTLGHLENLFSEVRNGDFMLLCGYFLSPGIRKGKLLVEILEGFRSKGVKLLLDTGWPTEGFTEEVREEIFSLLPAFDYFLPNRVELQALTGENLSRIRRYIITSNQVRYMKSPVEIFPRKQGKYKTCIEIISRPGKSSIPPRTTSRLIFPTTQTRPIVLTLA